MQRIKKSKFIISKSLFSTVLIQMFYFLYFLRMRVGVKTNLGTTLYILMSFLGIISLIDSVLVNKFRSKNKIVVFIAMFYVFGVVSSLHTNNYRLQDYLISIQYIGIALLIYRYKINYSVVRGSFCLYSIFFVSQILMRVNPNTVLIGVSRNNIPVFLLAQVSLLYIAAFQNNLQIKLFPAIILCIVSFWTIGRSAIFVSLLTLILLIVYLEFKSNKKNLRIIYLSLAIFGAYSVSSLFFFRDLIEPALNRIFRLGLLDSARSDIIIEYTYYLKTSFVNLLLGVPINRSSVFAFYGYNVHNSFLRLHAYHGLFGFALITICILKALRKFVAKQQHLYIILVSVLLIRAGTDIAAFHGPFDPLIFYFIFEGMAVSKKNSRINF